MKQIVLFLFFIAMNLHMQAQDTTRVLFIGNSITYFNNMPQTFEAIANSHGDTTAVTVYAPGGTGFVNHVSNPNVFAQFRQGNWDYVVLQPGSNESPGYSYPISETLSRGRILQDSIYKYNPCAKVLFYEISYGVWGNSASNLATYNNTMTAIRNNLTYLSDSTETFFAPVGEAFRTAWNQDQNSLLWGSYGDIHPNAKGSYIAACVFYATIFQKPSRGSTVVTSLSAADADFYQELADTTVLNYLSNWRINTFAPTIDFNYTTNGNTISFTNLSTNIDSSFWDFGDGTTSTVFDPMVTYGGTGNYNVTLTTYKNGCAKSMEQTVAIGVLGVENVKTWSGSFIYPNPTKDYLNIELEQDHSKYHFEVYNHLGELIVKTNKRSIQIAHLPNGIYYINVVNTETLESQIHKWKKYS
ncbi:T9SS type A sorting domain-containing protein [Aureispira sp. CCB-E]|uniref:T9SS type A sorting domain-containing protein n=1 Tax=Aureispira sp. CCB-E TaxID=3051121 RepID=UPI0028695FAB|nr:T9SS type A sorting domain-containing protein [Aureispira sp. CCB-E]WMX16480.1 T9SS type A sorting domain-containing protein [Aureispira sp. CCB-E]